MNENDTPREEEAQEDIKTGEESPGYAERPQSPDPGHPAGETSPADGLEPGAHEHPEDVRQPSSEEGDETSTESPATPPDPQQG
jgi:hypothetical protein